MGDRDACYIVRDKYYECLEIASDARKSTAECAELRKEYDQLCRKSWVKYWDDRRKKGLPIRSVTGDELSR